MTRRTALVLIGGAAAFPSEIHYRKYSECLPTYLRRLAVEAYGRRESALSAIQSPDAFRERQAWVRRTFFELTGGEPKRTPLNLKTTGSFERRAWKVEKIVYESEPGVHVTGLLYIPKLHKPPYPGVVFQCGHSLNGKAAEPYQKCCQGLASLGYLVLAFDPSGQGERTCYPKAGGTTTRLHSADDEHDRAGRLLLLTGLTETRLQTWDAVRSLDVLAAHPLVDPKRLASTGQSGGATLTMFLIAADDRLAAAAVSSGNTENFASEEFHSPGSVDDAEQNILGSGPLGFDRWDLLYPLAPKPLMVMASARDFFGTYSPDYLVSGRREFRRLSSFYKLLGKPDALEWYETPLPHALSKDMRVQVYDFFGRKLMGTGKVTTEPETAPEPDDALNVGPTGNALRDFSDKHPAVLASEWVASHRTRFAFPQVDPPPKSASLQVLGKAVAEHGSTEGVEVAVNDSVYLPGYLFIPAAKPRGVLLIVEPRGRTAHWREGEMYPALAQAGYAVAAFDIRGIGDLSPEVAPGNPFYTRPHATEEAYAWASLILGKPMLNQRVTDILSLVAAIRNRSEWKNMRVGIAARGPLTIPALLAASRSSSVEGIYCAGGLSSYEDLLKDPDQTEPLANLVPGIVHMIDLKAVRAALGSRYREGSRWDTAALSTVLGTHE